MVQSSCCFQLVSNEVESYIKSGVDSIDQQIMFAEKSWGSYRVLDVGTDSLTVKVTLNPGHGMNYHSHERRNEVWTVVSGTGTVVVDVAEMKRFRQIESPSNFARGQGLV